MAFDSHVHTRVTSGGGTGGGSSVVSLTVINGQPVITFVDTTRGNKVLSVTDNQVLFSENNLGGNDWIRPGHAVDGDSGFIMPLDGTVTMITGHCENTGANSKNIHLYIDAVDQGSIGTLSGGANAQFVSETLDLDFSQGQKLRLRSQQGSGGQIQDTVVKVTFKWRG